MRRGALATAAVALALTAISPTYGQADDWAFQVSPYIWLAASTGDVTWGNQVLEIELDREDIIKAADIGGSVMGIVQRGQWLGWLQVDGVSLSSDADRLKGFRGIEEFESDVGLFAAAAGYRFEGPIQRSAVDVLVGARHISMKHTVRVMVLGELERSMDVTDGIVVLRPSLPLGERFAFNMTLAVGAGESDITYEVQPDVQYFFTENIAARAGYRYVYYEFEGAEVGLETAFEGFFAGVDFMF